MSQNRESFLLNHWLYANIIKNKNAEETFDLLQLYEERKTLPRTFFKELLQTYPRAWFAMSKSRIPLFHQKI